MLLKDSARPQEAKNKKVRVQKVSKAKMKSPLLFTLFLNVVLV
jgi:hypothetical protein